MQVLIVEKIRRGEVLRVTGLTPDAGLVRLVPSAEEDWRWAQTFRTGELWEIAGEPAPTLAKESVEEPAAILVHSRQRLPATTDVEAFLAERLPIQQGAVGVLFESRFHSLPSGALYQVEDLSAAMPESLLWKPDRPLTREESNGRVRYLYPAEGEVCAFAFVGFQEPLPEIPAGTLLWISAGPWRSAPERPEEPRRRLLQLSGWFLGSPELPQSLENGIANQAANEIPRTPHSELRAHGGVEEARRVLSQVFGYDEFRPLQETIIANVLAGRNTLGVMPTGSGKSLCYQIPALVMDGLTVVLSPLLALMQDQVDQLRQAGVTAVTLNSMLTPGEYVNATRQVRNGEAKLLYVAPETLLRGETLALLEQTRLACLTVDEAHCISEWGHDFRPEYRRLREVRQRFPKAVYLALTATATPRVRDDIRTSLGIPARDTFVAGFDRPNLFLAAQRREAAEEQVWRYLAERPGQSGILYCGTRDQVDTLTRALQARNIPALPYHAGLDDRARQQNQRRFLLEEGLVMVATVAFGMGINKPDVRFVVHCHLPDSLETYYQQIGRAGRDGLPSDCLLLHSGADVGTLSHFIESGAPAERAGRSARLQAMVRYARAADCRRAQLLPYFEAVSEEIACGACDNCLAEAAGRQRVDVSEEARLFLQCVQQTGERFGVVHLVDVLRGSRAEKVLRLRHERLAIHGAGKQRPAAEWRTLADRFLEAGIVEAELEHGTLRLTAAGREVLAGGSVEVVFEEAVTHGKESGETAEADFVLFDTLRRLRRELAEAAGLPPYMLFSDRTLTEMAIYYPRTLEELRRVHGVGEHKADTYGEVFLERIRAHVEAHGLTPTPRAGEPAKPRAPKPVAGARAREVGAAFAAGETLAQLEQRLGVTETTLIRYLQDYQLAGEALPPEALLAECRLELQRREEVLALFEQQEQDLLGPINAALGGAVPYRELHLLRLYRRAS